MFKTNRNKKEKGQGLVEYALILVLVAIVVIAVLMLLGPIIGNVFSTINSSLENVGPGGVGGGGGGAAAAPAIPAGYPKSWGNPADNTSNAQACIDAGQSSGGTAYLWGEHASMAYGDKFYWTASSSPPVPGYALLLKIAC